MIPIQDPQTAKIPHQDDGDRHPACTRNIGTASIKSGFRIYDVCKRCAHTVYVSVYDADNTVLGSAVEYSQGERDFLSLPRKFANRFETMMIEHLKPQAEGG